jgi:pimeloyl-ACP methyl ester carboxylesterase
VTQVKSIIAFLIFTFSFYSDSYGMKKQTGFIQIEANLKIWVETYGDESNDAILLISGAGANSSFWSERLCSKLVEKGFYVVKYDHRDFGYSSKIDYEKHPFDVMQLTKDAITIMDSLAVEKAHIAGHSMGGFIAQLLAIHYPERVISMVSASASTNAESVPPPPPETWKIFMENNPTNNFENDLEGFLKVWKYLNGTAEFDKNLAVEYTRNLYERQEIKGAIGASHVKAQSNLIDRTELLKKLELPSLIIHGEEDYLVDKFGGVQTAECLRNSKLVLIPEMGHVLFNKKIAQRFEDEIIEFLIHL